MSMDKRKRRISFCFGMPIILMYLSTFFGRADKPKGVKFNNQPVALKKKISNTDEFRDFIEACFDPLSPMNTKLKEMMVKLAEDDDT